MKNIYLLILFLTTFLSGISFATTYHVMQQHPKASDNNTGSEKQPFRTISKAALLARSGDTVLVYAGIYREWVAPERSGEPGNYIVYKAVPNQKVVIKGSEIWQNEWKMSDPENHVYESILDRAVFGDYNPFFIPVRRMEGRLSLGQIFVNGQRYMQVDSLHEVKKFPETWMLSYDSARIIIHYDHNKTNISFDQSLLEFTARERIFSPHKRGLSYIHVEGFILEHSANQFPSGFYHLRGSPQAGALSTRAGNHWTIRNNTIRYAKSLGIDCGYGGSLDMKDPENPDPPNNTIGYHLIEYNTISDCGAGGIAGAHQRETVIRNNTIERCNYMNFTAPETGGIKVHFFYDGLIEGNLLRNNNCNGIWLDNVWYGSRVTRNVVLYSRGQGIFVEMGHGPCMVDNNIVAFTKIGEGIYLHDASGVTIAHNLLYANQHFGFFARIVTDRKATNFKGEREVVATKNLSIFNNIFIDNYRGHICLPLEDGNRIKNNKSDYNLFINGAQWQWEGLAYNSFTIKRNGEISADDLIYSLDSAFEKNEYPDSLRPNYNLWIDQPVLRFEWWQMLTGNDRNSVAPSVHTGNVENGAIAKGAMSLSDKNLFFDISNGATFMQLKVPKRREIDCDFYGNPVIKDRIYPGPFQDYKQEFNRFVIIPGN